MHEKLEMLHLNIIPPPAKGHSQLDSKPLNATAALTHHG
jgi:hypothetical protein